MRENALQSLAEFAGLYNKEEDLQKPKEGSAVIQVTKGRFYKTYLDIDDPVNSSKKKLKVAQKPTNIV